MGLYCASVLFERYTKSTWGVLNLSGIILIKVSKSYVAKETIMGNEKSCSVTGYVLSFLIGAAVGGGIALLTAPQSGGRARKQLKRMAGDVKENVEDYYDEMKDRTLDATKKVQDLYQETKRTMESKSDAAKKDFSK